MSSASPWVTSALDAKVEIAEEEEAEEGLYEGDAYDPSRTVYEPSVFLLGMRVLREDEPYLSLGPDSVAPLRSEPSCGSLPRGGDLL